MSNLFDKALESVTEDTKRFVDNSMGIADQIHHILSNKGISQRELAKRLGKKESEISKWLSGTHNFTLRSISKIEAALEEDILATPQKARKKYTIVNS